MKKFLINTFALIGFLSFILLISSQDAGILLDGIISAENNQIKNVADPTDDKDAVTKSYLDSNISSVSNSNGKYQLQMLAGNEIMVLNTASGVLVHYQFNPTTNGWTTELTPSTTFDH